MTVFVISSGDHSYGHYKVGAFLHQEFIDHEVESFFFNDQTFLAKQLSPSLVNVFHIDELQLVSEGLNCKKLLVVLDTIPFRRQNLLYQVLALRKRFSIQVITGHTGYFPYMNRTQLRYWKEALHFCQIKHVVIYHGQAQCRNRCHMCLIASHLNVQVIHTGLLGTIPNIPVAPSINYREILIMGGGGYQLSKHKDLLENIIEHNPEFRFSFLETHYSDLNFSTRPQITKIPASSNIPQLLSEFDGVIARSGYGSCVDLVQAQKATMFLPLNIEQEVQSKWALACLSYHLISGPDQRLKAVCNQDVQLPVYFNLNQISTIFQ